MLAGGLARFGFVTELLSMPVRLGYLMGIAVTVIAAQLPKLFGFSVEAESLIPAVRDFVARLGETDAAALALGVGSLAVIVGLRHAAPKVPSVFVAVAGATSVTACSNSPTRSLSSATYRRGCRPSRCRPSPSRTSRPCCRPRVGIAFVAFTDTSVLSRSYAARLRQDVNQNQELSVLGVANIATGLFQGFPLSTSSSRTAVAEDLGARSQFVGLSGAACLALLLILGTGLVQDLPLSSLAAVVIVAVLGLIDTVAERRLYRWRRSEFALSMTAFAGVAVLGVLWGSASRSRSRCSRSSGAPGAHMMPCSAASTASRPITTPSATRPRDSSRGWCSTGSMRRCSSPTRTTSAPGCARYRARPRQSGSSSRPSRSPTSTPPPARSSASCPTSSPGRGIELAFAELKDPVRDQLRRYGIHDTIGEHRFFPTLGVAVATYLQETGVDWIDWEERATTPRSTH